MAKRRRPVAVQEGGGDLLLDVLTAPVLGVPRLVHWVAKKLIEEVERQEFDEEKLQGQLLDLQMRHELGEIGDAGYAREETALLERLNYIRQMKEQD
ncbi:MAG: gas vesicle protein GvpG [Dehalococcoidia bacterium]|nr:gas vesicle protein GvpG [Dehalococcoidia bacterium]